MFKSSSAVCSDNQCRVQYAVFAQQQLVHRCVLGTASTGRSTLHRRPGLGKRFPAATSRLRAVPCPDADRDLGRPRAKGEGQDRPRPHSQQRGRWGLGVQSVVSPGFRQPPRPHDGQQEDDEDPEAAARLFPSDIRPRVARVAGTDARRRLR